MTQSEKVVYLTAVMCTVLSTVLFITPTTYHRLRFREHDKEHLIWTANRLAVAGTVLLAAPMSCAAYLVAEYVFDVWVGLVATVCTAAAFGWFWYALPLRRSGSRRPS